MTSFILSINFIWFRVINFTAKWIRNGIGGFRPSWPVMVTLLVLLSSLEALLMRYPKCRSLLTPDAIENCLRKFLSDIMLVTAMVTFLVATISLEAMSIFSSHPCARWRFVQKIQEATDNPDIKFLCRRKMWWIDAAWIHCKVEARTKKKVEA